MPHIRTVLLYGCPGTGKTLLAKAIACGAGAAWFDLSPWNTHTKFAGGKNPTLLVHMVGLIRLHCLLQHQYGWQ